MTIFTKTMLGIGVAIGLAGAASAQTSHDHGSSAGQGAAGQQGMPEQCRAMMQNMPQGCMNMMQGMHGGMMGRGAMMGGGMQQPGTQAQNEATKAYMAAMDRMHGPMMQGVQDPNADIAFVQGMIPHHQGAIDMAKVVLANGKDDEVKKMAQKVIDDQTKEIGDMQAWLKKQGK